MAIITSIQQITIALTGTSNTTTITSVDTSKSVVFLDGWEDANTLSTDIEENMVRIDLQSSTLVRARRDTDGGFNITVFCTVVEYDEIIDTIQQSEAVFAGSTVIDVAITAIDQTRSAVLYQGLETNESSNDWNQSLARLDITSDTNVRARRSSTTNAVTVNFTVIEFVAAAIQSISSELTNITSTNLTDTAIRSAVDLDNTILINAGWEFTGSTSDTHGDAWCHVFQTNTTTMTATRADNEGSCQMDFTSVEFVAGVLESVARDVLTQSNGFSVTTTTHGNTVDLDFAHVNHLGRASISVNHDDTSTAMSLIDTTRIRLERTGSVGSMDYSYEVIEFVDGALPGDGGFAFSQGYVMG